MAGKTEDEMPDLTKAPDWDLTGKTEDEMRDAITQGYEDALGHMHSQNIDLLDRRDELTGELRALESGEDNLNPDED